MPAFKVLCMKQLADIMDELYKATLHGEPVGGAVLGSGFRQLRVPVGAALRRGREGASPAGHYAS